MENTGFEANPVRTEGTYSKYNSLDDRIDGLHYYTTYIKFGIGRARFDASQEIRNGHITREEGIALAHKYEGEFPHTYFQDIIDFMGISEDEFWRRTDQARSAHLWRQKSGKWVLWQELPKLQGKINDDGLPHAERIAASVTKP